MIRYPDWPSRLESFLFSQAEREFRYGSFDCGLFVCAAIEAMTGVDPGARFRGRYDSARTAVELIRESGSLAAVVAECGLEEIPMPYASRGDVVLLKRHTLGIVALDGAHAIVPVAIGLMWVPLAGIRAWRV